jgi:trans-aconitate methyltransferase
VSAGQQGHGTRPGADFRSLPMFEWDASDYRRQSSLQWLMAEELLTRLSFRGDERVLDIGCGDGKITAVIAEGVPQGSVLGIDPSQRMITHASKNHPPQQHPNLRFEVGDAREIAYRQEFDVAVSFNALHWVHEQDQFLNSLLSALKPQGRAYLRFVPEGPRLNLEDVAEQVIQVERWKPYFQGHTRPYAHFTPDQYRALAEQAGFRVLNIRDKGYAWPFKSREAFIGWFRATFGVWANRVPEELRDTFINEVLDAYQPIAADSPEEVNVLKFHQMDVELQA